MERINKSVPASFITLGVVFLILGFVQKDFLISFESGFFILGLLFLVGGFAAFILNRRKNESDK
jgi:hypothetical protein